MVKIPSPGTIPPAKWGTSWKVALSAATITLDSRDDRHAYIGYVFKNLTALVVSLAPNTGIGHIAERGEINSRNEITACAG
jgi:hypothetical protein